MNIDSVVAQGGNHSFVVTLTSGRSFELSFEQLLAHTMRLQEKRGTAPEAWGHMDGQPSTPEGRGMPEGTPLRDSKH